MEGLCCIIYLYRINYYGFVYPREGEDMRKKLIFSVLIAIIATMLACVLYLPVSAEADGQITVTYYQKTTAKNSEHHTAGESFTLRDDGYSTTTGKTFFGWFTEDGVLYAPGSTCSFDKDTKLYEAYGNSVGDADTFFASFKTNWNYTKLTSDITISITSNPNCILLTDNCVGIIDLNGHKLTVTTGDDCFGGKGIGVILLGEGTFEYKSNNPGRASGIFSVRYATTTSCGLRIGKNVTVLSNGGLGDSWQVSSGTVGYPVYDIYGTVKVRHAVNADQLSGTQTTRFNVYDGAKVEFTSDCLFNSVNCTANTAVPYVEMNVYGGQVITTNTSQFFDNPDRYAINVTGGSFSRGYPDFIKSSYSFIYNETTGLYDVVYTPCLSPEAVDNGHEYSVVGFTVTCEEAGTITYKCSLCGEEYVEPSPALGHQMFSTLAAQTVATKEKTEPGYYKHTCIRCGYSYNEYFYPDPASVYVNVRVRYTDKNKTVEETIRVPSTDLFGFNGTVLRLYDFQTITYQYPSGKTRDFRMSDIIGLEIPLGTTVINGGIQNKVPYGVFRDEKYIEEITIPGSVTEVYGYAFSNMEKIKKINGIENITGTIGEHAFEQSADSALYFDTLTLNANTINSYAFYNVGMSRIVFAKPVEIIRSYSFASASAEKNAMVKEVIVEKNNKEAALEGGNGTTLRQLQYDHALFASYDNNGQSYFAASNVFYDHEYEDTTVPPTCVEDGYDLHVCKNCGYSYMDNTVSKTGVHIYSTTPDEVVKSTCSNQGYEIYKCTMCTEVRKKILPLDENTHDYTYSVKYVDFDGNEVYPCQALHFNVGICKCGREQPLEGLEIKRIIDHDYSILVDERPSNCGVQGYEIHKCSYCGEENRVDLPLVGRHRSVKNEAKSTLPTCVADGENVYTCEVCGLTTNTVRIDKDPEAHSWDTGTVVEEPTDSKMGKLSYKCIYCGTERLVSIPRTNSDKMPTWLIVVIVAGGVLLAGGIVLTLYFTLFKKKNASLSYKYKFNTLGKK